MEEFFKLNDGNQIPKLGYGTWITANDASTELVADAISVGYRHIDTAEKYENEYGVGEGIRKSSVNREDLFITTKLLPDAKDYQSAADRIDESLKSMELEYFDLVLIHSAMPDTNPGDNPRAWDKGNREAWRALEDAVYAGKIRSIGVSNFSTKDIDNILSECRIKPAVNQIMAHVGQMPWDMIEYDNAHGILTQAYSPIAHGGLLRNETVKQIGESYGVGIAQISLKYLIQKGICPVAKATKVDHMKSNLDLDFVISEEDIKALDEVVDISFGKYEKFEPEHFSGTWEE